MSHPSEAIGRRIGAFAIDLVPQIVIFVVLGLALGEGESSEGRSEITLENGEVLLWLALVSLYFFACEAIWGQTLGKWILGLVVVGPDGTRAGVGPVAVRNLLRPLDMFPFYLIGLLTMLLTPHKQRVGDLAAGTFVTLRGRQGQPPAATPSGWAPPVPPTGPPPPAAPERPGAPPPS